MSNTNKVYASGIKGKPKKPEKKVVSIDITELYEELKKKADSEVRSVEEQCKYFIKQGLGKVSDSVTTVTYVQQPTYVPTPRNNYPWEFYCDSGRTTYGHAVNNCGVSSEADPVIEAYATTDGTFEPNTAAAKC